MELIAKKMKPKYRQSGFTLIELLVVISIISLLIAILLPALGAARKSAMDAMCKVNLRSMGQGVAAYASDSKDFMPLNARNSIWFFYYLKSKAHQNNPVNLGLLYAGGYNAKAETYYCPLQTVEPWTYKPETFWKNQGEVVGATGNTTGGYNYWLRTDLPDMQKMWYGNDYIIRLTSYGQHAFASDLIFSGLDTWAHTNGQRRLANIASSDGSVRPYVDEDQQITAMAPFTTATKLDAIFKIFDDKLN